MAEIIKHITIYSTTIYFALKLLRQLHNKYYIILLIFVYATPLALLSHYLMNNLQHFTHAVPLLFIWLIVAFISAQPRKAFISIMIVFGLNYCLFVLNGFIITIAYSLFFYKNSTSPFIILSILSSICHLLTAHYLFKLKRFRKGLPFLYSPTTANIIVVICFIFMFLLVYIPSKLINVIPRLLSISLFIATFAILIFWWQAQLTKSYKHSIQLRELESLRLELEEKDNLIRALTEQNQELGRLIHKDNKLIPAMNHAVCEYLVSDEALPSSMKEKGQSLILELQHLSEHRTQFLSEINAKRNKHHNTDIHSLNTLLNYMEQRAKQENILLSVHIAVDLNTYIPTIISADDLVHMLSDLMENAFIACSYAKEHCVQLQFYQSQKHFIIEIADSGIPFEVASLHNLGITQSTTHADNGGQGFGSMNIWNTKDKYAASLHITEYETAKPYTKKIAILFNKKNRYSISSYRHAELSSSIKRTDLQIYSIKDE